MSNKYWIGLIFCLLLCGSCKEKTKKVLPKTDKKEVKAIKEKLNVTIYRYEQVLFGIDRKNIGNELNRLKKDYALFLGENPNTQANIRQLEGFIDYHVHQDLYKAVQKQFPSIDYMEDEFSDAFSLIKYHFPQADFPKIYTAILGLDFENPIIYQDTFLIIALDMYLGSDFSYYKQLGVQVPVYIIRKFSKEYILRDCIKALAYPYMQFNRNNTTLLDEMIIEGKRLMFAEIALPNVHDTILSGYSLEKWEWAQENEANIWTYMIDKNYLYTYDNTLIVKFMKDAPFTAYFGNTSPGQIGVWMGWQICRAWVKNNPDKPIIDLMNEKDSQKILKESKYKPRKNK